LKQHLKDLLLQALSQLKPTDTLPTEVQVERSRDNQHGDFASNVALVLAKVAKRAPRELAQEIIGALPSSEHIERVEIAGPGFINFFLKPGAILNTVTQILAEKAHYGRLTIGQGKRILVEFVSANPNGPLHIGHGRGAAYGSVIANLLEAAGFSVHREYYVNDAGRQMDILAVSVWLRYLELLGETVTFPEKAYRGEYVKGIASDLHAVVGDTLFLSLAHAMENLPVTEDADRDADALVQRVKDLLGPSRYETLHRIGLDQMRECIRRDLADFGVEYDTWFSERSLTDDGSVDRAIARLTDSGRIYVKDGAHWFNSSAFGDEKDRVVIRENGQKTYFASDIAYHMNKCERGFDQLIDIWGADHHGYVPRVKGALAALGEDPERLEVLLVQFATLYRGKERVQMSTRAGEFVTLRELFEEVGKDATRFFYVMRRCEQHLDFDLELAKSQSADNPVYYIQYAHARIASVFRQLKDKGLDWDQADGSGSLGLLTASEEQALIQTLARYPEVVESAALSREPHQIPNYLRDLATSFHAYYTTHQFLVEDTPLRNARLNLIVGVKQVIQNGLALLGVTAPEVM
jgi:arginyl-tRNA synthetase